MQGRSECEVWVQRVQPIGWGLGQCWVGVSKLVLTSGARFSILREGSGAGSRSHGGTLGQGWHEVSGWGLGKVENLRIKK